MPAEKFNWKKALVTAGIVVGVGTGLWTYLSAYNTIEPVDDFLQIFGFYPKEDKELFNRRIDGKRVILTFSGNQMFSKSDDYRELQVVYMEEDGRKIRSRVYQDIGLDGKLDYYGLCHVDLEGCEGTELSYEFDKELRQKEFDYYMNKIKELKS